MNNSIEKAVLKRTPEEAATIIRKYKPRRITVMFDSCNYLFTDCKTLSVRMDNVMTVESHDFMQNPLYIKDFNCGYGGVGPGRTEDLLKLLGVPATKADYLSHKCNGFQISFDESGRFAGIDRDSFPIKHSSYDYIERKNGFPLPSERSAFDLRERKLYILGLNHKDTYMAFLWLLLTQELVKVSYYVGNKNNDNFALPYLPSEYIYAHSRELDELMNGSYILVEGKTFTTIAFIGPDAPMAYVNNIAVFLSGSPEFSETIINSDTLVLRRHFNRRRNRILPEKDTGIRGYISAKDWRRGINIGI